MHFLRRIGSPSLLSIYSNVRPGAEYRTTSQPENTPLTVSNLLDLALKRLFMLVRKLRACGYPTSRYIVYRDLQNLKHIQGAGSGIGHAGSIW